MTRLARARRNAVHAEQRAAAEVLHPEGEEQRFACALQCPAGVDLMPLGRAAQEVAR